MRNRREFIKTVAGATAGALLMGRELVSAQGTRGGRLPPFSADPPSAPVQRRIVQVGGRRVPVVDVHAHISSPEVAAVVKGTEYEKRLGGGAGGGRAMGPERVWELDKRGIDIQAVHINGFAWYEVKDRDLAAKIVRTADEGIAAQCKTYPDRFVGFTSPALQFPDLAADQLEYAVKQLGFRAAAIAGHMNGESFSDPKYDVFWAKAQELGVPVFEHPAGADNIIKDNAWRGLAGDLGNIIGNPLETGFFLTRMMLDGTLDKFPNLRLIGAHGGGYLPSYLGRTEVACQVRRNANCTNAKQPTEYFKDQIFVDSMVFSPEDIRHLVAKIPATQVLYGTDVPIYQWPDSVDDILKAEIPNAQKEMILGGNTIKLLKLTPPKLSA